MWTPLKLINFDTSMRSLLVVLAADIDCTTLERKRYRRPLQQRAYPSTWGWLKKLPEEAETIVQLAREPLNSTTLFHAMLSVETVYVMGTNHTGLIFLILPLIKGSVGEL